MQSTATATLAASCNRSMHKLRNKEQRKEKRARQRAAAATRNEILRDHFRTSLNLHEADGEDGAFRALREAKKYARRSMSRINF